jgi:hypothetical protein
MGLRWQLRPGVAGVLLLVCSWLAKPHSGVAATSLCVLGALCVLVSLLVCWFLPPYVDLDAGNTRRFQHVGFRDVELSLSADVRQNIAAEAVERPSANFRMRIFYPAVDTAAATAAAAEKGGLLVEEGGGTTKQSVALSSTAVYAERGDWVALSQVAGVPLPPFVYSHMGEMTIPATVCAR